MPFTKEELELRKTFIGGSDAAAVLGLSRWKTPIEVWAEKTGLIEPEDISQKPQVRFGVKMEAVLAEMWMEDTGETLHRKTEIIRHPKYPFMAAHIDRGKVGERAGWEAKYFAPWRAAEFEGGEFPADCLIQCNHYLAVTGWDRWYLCVGIGNQEPIKRTIERDEELIKNITEKEVHFWNTFVVPKVMPATVTAQDGDLLYKLYPKAKEGVRKPLPDRFNALKESLDALRQDKNVVEKQIAKIENEIKAAIGNDEIGDTGTWEFKWQNVHTGAYQCPEKNFRKLVYKRKEA